MKRYLIILMSICAAVAVVAQDSIPQRLDSLLRAPMFETTQVGLMVYDLTGDSVVYKRNERQLMRPASCMKLVTAITALDRLGADYELRTQVYYTGRVVDSTLVGNLYCVGGFDPMLSYEDVAGLAAMVRDQLGIDSIRGQIVADCSMKEPLDYGEGWCWDDDNPLLIPLSIGRKNVFLKTFAEETARLGINLEQVCLTEGQRPSHARLVATVGHSLSDVLMRMMKVSDNFYAESVFYQTAASTGHRPAKAADARGLTKKLIARLGLNADTYRIADGSGLSLYNYVTPELLVKLLRHAWRKESMVRTLFDVLPIAGIDGTLKDRMKKTSAHANVRAKTGTLTGISSLAGYCIAANGNEYCFAIINQGVMRNMDGKNFQNKVCQVLCDP